MPPVDLSEVREIGHEEVKDKPPAPPAGAPAGDQAAPLVDRDAQAREWAELPEAVGSILTLGLPELQEVYSEENCLRWGRRMQKAAEKKGWSPDVLGPWPLLIVSSVIFLAPTLAAVKVRRLINAGELPPEAARDMQSILKAAREKTEVKVAEREREEAGAVAAGARPQRVEPVG